MFIQKWRKEGIESKKKKSPLLLPQHIRQNYQEFKLHETSHIYKKDLHQSGLQSFMSDGPEWSSSQWHSWVEGWRGGGMGRGGMVVGSWQCHHGDCSRHARVTEHRPVTSSQQPNDKDASPSGSVISGLTGPLFPSFIPASSFPYMHIHTRTHTHGRAPLPVTIKMVKWDVVSNTKRLRPSQIVGRLRRNLQR